MSQVPAPVNVSPSDVRRVHDPARGPAGEPVSVVVARVGDRCCGLPVAEVEEVHAVVRITPLPGAPDTVEGVVDLRGAVVPVLDGRRRLGVAPRPVQLSDRLVFLRAGDRRVALRVDAVAGLADVAPADLSSAIAAAPAALRGLGIGRLADGLLVVHDTDAFLSASQWDRLGEALRRWEREPAR